MIVRVLALRSLGLAPKARFAVCEMQMRLPLRPLAFSSAGSRWQPADEGNDPLELDSLSVVTLNTWFDPFEAAQRARGLIAHVRDSDADVICLQEVTPELCARLQGSPEIRDEMELVVGTGVGDAYGNAILSRLPVTRAWELELTSIMNRALVAIELSTSHGRLTIATVHLESTRSLRASRVAQLREVFAALEGDALLLGDFNFDPADPEEDALDPRFVDVWPRLRPDEPGFTEDTTNNPMRFDHHGMRDKHVRYDRVLACTRWLRPVEIALFATEPIGPRVHVSDHFGVTARFAR